MKKFFNFALLGAIAFAGAMFTSCQSDEDVQVNPTYDGESVKASFALNIPRAAKTRMSTETTQENGIFRGMQDIFLIPLKEVPTASTVFPFKNINLTALEKTEISSTQSSKIYQDVNIGVGTNNFLFYGEATATNITGKADKFANGILTKSLTTSTMNTFTTPSEITFDLNSVYNATAEGTEFTAAQNFLLGILNGVANVSFTKSGAGSATNWKNITVASDGLEYQGLVDLYAEYTKTARNGSGPNVLKTMQALYNNVHWIKEKATSADVKALCDAIMAKVAESFTPTHDQTTHDSGTNSSSPDFKPECYTLAYISTETKYTDFPKNTFALPYGAAELTCTGTAATPFAYNATPVGPGTTSGGANLNVADLCFPASLQYFCNTPAKANNKNVETWATTTADWDAFDSNWSTANGWGETVLSTTRSIALRNNINYGVAQLKATVKCSDANVDGTTHYLMDNSSARDGDGGTAEDIKVTIPSDGFTVTGILVGGQPQQVDWQFLPSAGTARSRIIYDNVLNGTIAAKAGAAEGVNYTLVLDNYNSTEQEKVNVAVEFVNNSGKDFWGYNGLIPAGSTFYMIGQLDPTSKTTANMVDPFPTTPYRYPATGNLRVFMQDYTTTANFTITDLKRAYSTIPDLRVAKLELGLSVDLVWSKGVTYDVTF